MINDLGFTKNAAILNEMVQQATGMKSLAPLDRTQFVTVATSLLKMGYDPLLNSISSVMGRTIFSVRPYRQQFKNLRVTEQQFGDMTRKLSMLDSEWEENQSYDLQDGESYDMYKVRKEGVLQVNFYGYQTYKRTMMIYRNQLNVAFRDYNEWQRFMSMKLQNTYDQITQGNEQFARGAITNLMMGVAHTSDLNIQPLRQVRLLSEYAAYSGDPIMTPADFANREKLVPFAMWFYARMSDLLDSLSNRSVLYHQHVNYDSKKPLKRHSGLSDLHVYMLSSFMTILDTTVHSQIFHNEYLKFVDYETVSFWQTDVPDSTFKSPHLIWDDRSRMDGKFTFMKENGSLDTFIWHEKTDPFVGVIFDKDACGYTIFDQHTDRTPWNAEGDYAKLYFKYTNRFWNDFTENAVVLMLD